MNTRLSSLLIAVTMAACGYGELEAGGDSNHGFSVSRVKGTEIVSADRLFANGFHVYSPDLTNGATITHRLVPPGATASPVWRLAQWYSKSTLVGVGEEKFGGWTWTSPHKRLTVAPGTLEMAINSDVEFDGVYRQAGENWPHLLAQQPLRSTVLSNAAQLAFQLQARIVYSKVIKEVGYDKDLHASKFRLNFTIVNRNPNSAGYGDFFWLIVPIYDDRDAFPGDGTHPVPDVGAGKLMYSVPYQELCATSAQTGETVTLAGDLLPHVKIALEDGVDNKLLTSGRLEDYQVGSVNIGFEMPGRGVLVAKSSAPSLRFVRKYR